MLDDNRADANFVGISIDIDMIASAVAQMLVYNHKVTSIYQTKFSKLFQLMKSHHAQMAEEIIFRSLEL